MSIEELEYMKTSHKVVDNSLIMINDMLKLKLEDIEKDSDAKYALYGAVFFFVQGLMDISNYLMIMRDLTPTNYRDIFGIMIRMKMIDEKYSNIVNMLVDIRNKLLFLYDTPDIGYLYDFVKNNIELLNELYHDILKLMREI